MKRLPFPLELLKKYRREGEVWRGNRQGFPLRATITRTQATEVGDSPTSVLSLSKQPDRNRLL